MKVRFGPVPELVSVFEILPIVSKYFPLPP